MDVYQYAMQMEKDGEAYYRECAAKTATVGLRGILTMLADAETMHYDLFRRMQAQQDAVLPDSALIDQVKNVFAEIREREGASGVRSSELDLYRKAQELERKSWELYESHAAKAASPAEKLTFERIAVEERRHYRILEGIIDFVSRPQTWLENAEWTHLDDY
jgi:rubrerythrin